MSILLTSPEKWNKSYNTNKCFPWINTNKCFPCVMVFIIRSCLCLYFHWSSSFNKYLLYIFQNFLVNTSSLIFVKEKGNIMAITCKKWTNKKFTYVVNIFEIRDTYTSILSIKSSKNIPVLILIKKTPPTMRVFFCV